MTEKRKSFRGYVRVKDGVIAAVSAGSPVQIDNDETIIDAAGCVLMPGLVNAHTHLYQVLLRAVWEDLPLLPWLKRIYGAAQVLRPEHFYAGTMLGCMEAIQTGVTTLCEHNFLNPHPECAFDTVRAIRDAGLRAVFARTIMDTGDIVPDCVKENSDQAFRHIDEIIAANKDNDLLSFMTGPNTPPLNTTPDLLRDIRRFADEKSIGISAHVAESKSVVEFTREKHGQSGVVKFLDDFGIPSRTSLFAHCVHISDDEIQILKQRGTSVSHNPVSNMMLGDGVAPVVAMLRHGVNVALGTDGAASNHSQDLFETMKTASLLQKVHHQDAGIIDPYAVLQYGHRWRRPRFRARFDLWNHRGGKAGGSHSASLGYHPQPTRERSLQPARPLRQGQRCANGHRRWPGSDERSPAPTCGRKQGLGRSQKSQPRSHDSFKRIVLLALR